MSAWRTAGVVVAAGAALVTSAVACAEPASALPHVRTTAPPPSVRAFLARADRGTAGTFEGTYVVRGNLIPFPGSRWVDTIGHRPGGPGGGPVGRWSYLVHANGWRLAPPVTVQWIERGASYADCYRHRATAPWRCGAGTNEASNGFAYLGLPFLVQQVLSDVRQVASTASLAETHGAVRLRTFATRSRRLGDERCLSSRVVASPPGSGDRVGSVTTWCLTSAGRVASVRSEGQLQGTWTYVQLLATSDRLPSALVRPFGTPRAGVALPGA